MELTMYDEQYGVERFTTEMAKALEPADVERISDALRDLPSTELVEASGSIVTVEHYAGAVSRSMIVEAMTRAGYRAKSEEAESGFGRSLKRMAESNRKNFGSGRLDCCDLPGK